MDLFNKKIFDFPTRPFGMDLSDLSVKIVNLDNEGRQEKVVSFGLVNIPPGSIIDGDIIKKEDVISAIKQVCRTSGPKKIRTKKVVCSLPETKSFLRILNIPRMDEREVKEAIKWEMEANIPISIDQVYYDWQILERNFGTEKNKISVLVVAVSRKTVDQFIEVIEGAGLDVAAMEIESISQNRSLLDDKRKEDTVLIVDLGDRRTSFSISVGNIPCFTSSIPLSSQSLTDATSKALNISLEEAEKMKLSYGIGSMGKNDDIFVAAKPVLENLASETEKFIDFYLTGLNYSSSVEKIIVCGGGANTKGIIAYMSKRLGKDVEIGNPWANFNMKKNLPIIEKEKSIRYSTAIGLALRALREE